MRLAHSNFDARAFTLIEAMLVMILIGLTAAVAVPMLSNSNDQLLMSAAQTLAFDIEYARDQAVMLHDSVQLTFSPVTKTYQLLDASDTPLTHPLTKQDYSVLMTSVGSVDMTLGVSLTDGGNTVIFDAYGTPDTGGTITLGHPTTEIQMKVSLDSATGTVTVLSENVGS